MTPPAWVMSTYHPQPAICREPSRSQPCSGSEMLQRTTVTTPDEAAWIGVPRGAPRSTPLVAAQLQCLFNPWQWGCPISADVSFADRQLILSVLRPGTGSLVTRSSRHVRILRRPVSPGAESTGLQRGRRFRVWVNGFERDPPHVLAPEAACSVGVEEEGPAVRCPGRAPVAAGSVHRRTGVDEAPPVSDRLAGAEVDVLAAESAGAVARDVQRAPVGGRDRVVFASRPVDVRSEVLGRGPLAVDAT